MSAVSGTAAVDRDDDDDDDECSVLRLLLLLLLLLLAALVLPCKAVSRMTVTGGNAVR